VSSGSGVWPAAVDGNGVPSGIGKLAASIIIDNKTAPVATITTTGFDIETTLIPDEMERATREAIMRDSLHRATEGRIEAARENFQINNARRKRAGLPPVECRHQRTFEQIDRGEMTCKICGLTMEGDAI